MHTANRYLALLLLSFCLILVACSKKETSTDNYPHLEFIPADTPYVYLGLEPMSDKTADHFYKIYDQVIDAYGAIVKQAYKDYRKKAQEEDTETGITIETTPSESQKWLDALAREFADGFKIDALKKYGIDRTSVGGFYGHGVLPVFRMSLTDTKLFKQAIERIEKDAGESIPTIAVDNMNVWALGDDDEGGKLIIALSENDLIISFKPENTSQEFLEQLLGIKKPTKSLANTNDIKYLLNEKGYLAQGLGYIDFTRVLQRFINEPTGIDQEVFELFDLNEKSSQISKVCKTELTDLVNKVPRLIFGLTELSEKGMSAESLIEIEPSIAKEMTKLTSVVPGLGESAGFFSMGFSFNIAAIKEFANQRLEKLADHPFKCEFLHIDADQFQSAKASLNNPASGFVEGLRGFNFVIDNLDVDAVIKVIQETAENPLDTEKFDPKQMQTLMDSLSGRAILSVDNTKNLYNTGKMFSPELAKLNLEANGKPVLVNDLSEETMPFDLYVSMTKNAFTFTLGKDADKPVKLKPSKNNNQYPPLLSYSINSEQYMKLLSAIIELPEVTESLSDDQDAELDVEQVKQLIKAMYGVTGDTTASIRFRDDGIAFEQKTVFVND